MTNNEIFKGFNGILLALSTFLSATFVDLRNLSYLTVS